MGTAQENGIIACGSIFFDQVCSDEAVLAAFLLFVAQHIYQFELRAFQRLEFLLEHSVRQCTAAIEKDHFRILVAVGNGLCQGAERSDAAAACHANDNLCITERFICKYTQRF